MPTSASSTTTSVTQIHDPKYILRVFFPKRLQAKFKTMTSFWRPVQCEDNNNSSTSRENKSCRGSHRPDVGEQRMFQECVERDLGSPSQTRSTPLLATKARAQLSKGGRAETFNINMGQNTKLTCRGRKRFWRTGGKETKMQRKIYFHQHTYHPRSTCIFFETHVRRAHAQAG